MKKICVLGLGYIGLPTAAMFGTHGFEVVGVDINRHVVQVLRKGDIHIEEPGLRTLVEAALRSGHLAVQEQPEEADVFIVAVPTPLAQRVPENGERDDTPHADLSAVTSAAHSIVPFLREGNLVILESTSPPGTTLNVLCPLLEESGLRVGRDLLVAHSPERVLPGRVLEELVRNDRVIGGIDGRSAEEVRRLYASFVEGEIFLTDATTAEMVKLMENTYRDVNIALANEFALVAEHVGINVWEAIELANRHPRVKILKPGPGVGGHCIAVDPWFIAEAAPEITPLIQTARWVNDAMPEQVVACIRKLVTGLESPVVAVLGLAYKANVDDARESPAVQVVQELERAGYEVRASDPYVRRVAALSKQPIALDDALAGADCIVLLTDHTLYANLSPQVVAQAVRSRIVLDTRGCLNLAAWETAGFHTALLGQSNVVPPRVLAEAIQ